MKQTWRWFFIILFLAIFSAIVALPAQFSPSVSIPIGSQQLSLPIPLKQGLDIQGGLQVILSADMSQIDQEDRTTALQSAQEVIARRIDLYGVNEPRIQTVQFGDTYQLVVELAGVSDPQQALELIGTTAQLDFRVVSQNPELTNTELDFSSFETTQLSGSNINRALVQFDPNTGQPVVSLEFDSEGRQIFADLTQQYQGQILGIFLDDIPLMLPTIQEPIVTGQAVITGGFTIDEAKLLATQLNAGALPVSLTIQSQQIIGPSLGQEAIQASTVAGLVGIACVIFFMIGLYGWRGVLASMALILYGVFTLALYKLLGVTLTVPGIAGLLLSIGMAVDANILIFERMNEEMRRGKVGSAILEQGFGRAWDSIKDANLATILTALVLINPFNLPFLNTNGLVRGFGVTLLIGVVLSLFTGVVVSRTFLQLFWQPKS